MRWPRRALAFSAMGAVLLGGWIITRNAIFPDQHGAKVFHFMIESHYVNKELETTVIVPKGVGKKPPLLIFLHGRNGDQDSELRNGMRQLFSELKLAVEPACAAATAALLGPLRETLQGKRVGVLLGGTNTDAGTFAKHMATP